MARPDRVGNIAERLEALFDEGVETLDEAAGLGWYLGAPGRLVAMLIFAVAVSPVLAAGALRRAVRKVRRG